MKEQGSQPLGVSQKQQKLDLKAAGSAAVWNMPATWSEKVVLCGALETWWLGWVWEYQL